jgi:hypothetical protein
MTSPVVSDAPRKLWPPLRAVAGIPLAQANWMHWLTSAVVAQYAMAFDVDVLLASTVSGRVRGRPSPARAALLAGQMGLVVYPSRDRPAPIITAKSDHSAFWSCSYRRLLRSTVR